MSARVTFYTRAGCHLCDVARDVVARVCAELGETFDEVDIDGDPELRERFTEEVPVTFVDGRIAKDVANPNPITSAPPVAETSAAAAESL